jgi:hypothetical protein
MNTVDITKTLCLIRHGANEIQSMPSDHDKDQSLKSGFILMIKTEHFSNKELHRYTSLLTAI